jgi:Asp-tRNA(Asn)/Glu-tRNA(Gln) amidotransferase B subunit
MTLQEITKLYLDAMKSKDIVAKALFSTFKGQVESELKSKNAKSELDIIQSLVKKFTENAKLVNTEDSKKEILLLLPFMPKTLDTNLYDSIAKIIINNNQSTVNEIKAGNKVKIGFLVGMFMKESKVLYPGLSVDPKLVNEIIVKNT